MKLSLSISEYLFDYDQEKMFRTLSEAGYTATDYNGMNIGKLSPAEEDKYCRRTVELAKKYGIELRQAHAPFGIDLTPEEFFGKEAEQAIVTAMERAARLGIKYIAFHPYSPRGIEEFVRARTYDYNRYKSENMKRNLEFFGRFVPVAERTGVMPCIENVFAYDLILMRHVRGACSDPDETNWYIDNLGEKYFGACYDSGHHNHYGGDETDMITRLGKRLKITHLHDSWGKEFYGMDWHMTPGSGDVSWDKVAAALTAVGYEGSANFEVNLRPEPYFFLPQLRYTATVGDLIFNNNK